jgi:hypothetical protein
MRAVLILLTLLPLALACPDKDYCLNCDFANKKCLYCDGVIYDEKKNECVGTNKPIGNCRRYGATDKPSCIQCDNGFGLNTDFTQCVKCELDGCARCDGDAKACSNCFGSKVLTPALDKCVEDSSISLPNCEVNAASQAGKQSICLQCKKGFTRKAFACDKETISNCAEILNDKCVVCRSGFFINIEGKCTVNGEHPKPPKPSGGSVWIWIFVILLLAAGAGGAYWYVKIRPQAQGPRGEAFIA